MGTATDLAADYEALRHGFGARIVGRDAVRVTGPDAVEWLQGQLSQDVAGLPVGESAASLLLSPRGRIDALLRATRTADDAVVLDVEGGFGPAIVERLRRFQLRVRAELVALEWCCVALRGPLVSALDLVPGTAGTAGGSSAAGKSGAAALVAPSDWPGVPGLDLLGEDPSVPSGARSCGAEAWEAVRIEAGAPAMGREIDERTIPAEADLVERAVSLTKGCFTGQELVARLDARGSRVARHLRGLVLDGDQVPAGGAEIVDSSGKAVGELTSAAWSPGLTAVVALGYVHRSVEPPARVAVRSNGAEVEARVETLPLVGDA